MKIPKIFNSMYIKWTLALVALLLAALAMTAAFSFQTIILEISDILEDKMTRKAVLIINMHEGGYEITEDIMMQLGDVDMQLVFLREDDDASKQPYAGLVSFEMMQRVSRGEIVISHRNQLFHRVPYVVFEVNGKTALISPILPQNELTLFVNGIARAMVLNMVLSSVFVSAALLAIVLQIRKVTAATREVASGNFNVELFTRSDDEIGELMRNFNAMTRELRQSEYLKKDFVSTVSHEFKTPITAIEGFARLLQNENLTPAQRSEYTEIIIKETARLGGLSTNLLRLSVLDNSDLIPDAAPFYLDEQIRGTILLLERAWEEKNITFDINMDEMLYNGNEELLSHVWINILQNAIKFSPQDGTIGVKMGGEGGFVKVEITDAGPGIAPQHRDRVFTRFYKAGKMGTEGNGLGLPIAKRIVELSRGQIGFASQMGSTTFFVKLPR